MREAIKLSANALEVTGFERGREGTRRFLIRPTVDLDLLAFASEPSSSPSDESSLDAVFESLSGRTVVAPPQPDKTKLEKNTPRNINLN